MVWNRLIRAGIFRFRRIPSIILFQSDGKNVPVERNGRHSLERAGRMKTRRVTFLLVCSLSLLVTATSGFPSSAGETSAAGFSPLFSASDAPEDDYIVVLDADAVGRGHVEDGNVVLEDRLRSRILLELVLEYARSLRISVRKSFWHAINGFSARMTSNQLMAIRQDPRVAYVARDLPVSGAQIQSPTPSWGLDRIDQDALPLDGRFSVEGSGKGVTVYVLDSGVRGTHDEFSGRVVEGFFGVDDGRGTSDCYGHGTHVAGIIGGRTAGVARSVRISPVRVLDCQNRAEWSSIIDGIEWVTKTHSGPSVINLSAGGSVFRPVDEAVRKVVSSGVTVVVAALNEGADACGMSPARVPEAVTVGATTREDVRARFSDFGPCVDLFAPGDGIMAAGNGSDSSFQQQSGTSMAAPHVAGVIALILEENPRATPREVNKSLVSLATRGILGNLGDGSPNLLLRSD
jgi:subtilisin family serine protease